MQEIFAYIKKMLYFCTRNGLNKFNDYAAEQPEVKDKWNESNIHYNQW